MLTECFIAGRYLKVRHSAVSWITVTSIVGVTLGVAVLMIVLAVMTGFTDVMKTKLVETQAHFQVRSVFGPIKDRDAAVQKVEASGKGDVLAAPVITAPAMVRYGKRSIDPYVMALAFDFQKDLPRLQKSGRFDFDKMVQKRLPGEFPGRRGVIISSQMAQRWHVTLGSKIFLHSTEKLTKLIKVDEATGKVTVDSESSAYYPTQFVVTGIYSAGKYDFDRFFLFIDIDDAADLFELDYTDATAIFGWGKDAFNQRALLEQLQKEMSQDLKVRGWEENNQQLLNVLAVEKRMMFFLLIFIVLVAAFSIANTLITSVYQKTREIGVLKALGASDAMIRRVFLLQGFFIGLFGSCCGIALGATVIYFRNGILRFVARVTGSELFPKEFYYFNELPAKILLSDVTFIAVSSIVLCTVGALIPAMRAAHLDPAKALRYE